MKDSYSSAIRFIKFTIHVNCNHANNAAADPLCHSILNSMLPCPLGMVQTARLGVEGTLLYQLILEVVFLFSTSVKLLNTEISI